MTIEILARLLKELENTSDMGAYAGEYISADQEGSEAYPARGKVILEEIAVVADDVLIGRDGRPSGLAIERLKVEGYLVTVGEKDSFGWLSGIIHTKVGKVVFG